MELTAMPLETYPYIFHIQKKHKFVAYSTTILLSYLVFTLLSLYVLFSLPFFKSHFHLNFPIFNNVNLYYYF